MTFCRVRFQCSFWQSKNKMESQILEDFFKLFFGFDLFFLEWKKQQQNN